MADCRDGTGPNRNRDEDLVKMLLSKLTPIELERLERTHADVVHDSIAEAWQRSLRQKTAPHVAVNGC